MAPGGRTGGLVLEGTAVGLERHHFGRWIGHATLPRNPRGLQATRADLRQANDLLSAGIADDGGDP